MVRMEDIGHVEGLGRFLGGHLAVEEVKEVGSLAEIPADRGRSLPVRARWK